MEEERIYTTTELVKITGLSRAGVLRRARTFGYTKYCKYVLKRTNCGNYIKEYSFTESQVKTMGCDHYHRSEKVEEVIEKTDEDRLARLKREHPLVTDERCFILSWFPETIPAGFSEEEEDE